jgi:hypothetical protein
MWRKMAKINRSNGISQRHGEMKISGGVMAKA